MFNKRPDPDASPDAVAPRSSEPAPAPAPQAPARGKGPTATIGPSIRVRGDLSGDEDLVVQGEVEGTVSLPNNLVTVGEDGRVSATVHARVIHVEGTVEGDLNGGEQVILLRSGNVRGNIVAPRVTLEDGCRFKGSIDMDAGREAASKPGAKVADLKPAGGADDSKRA